MDLAGFHPRYFKVTQHSDIVVVNFSFTHINDEENIEELGHELFLLADQFGFLKINVNMAGVEYITSSVVGKLITLHRKLHRSRGKLIISNLTIGVSDVLDASRLLSYFTHCDTEEAALAVLRAHEDFEGDSTVG
ncbi:MAG: STAS domain-containing protein [Planctomycetota bacterium]|nr:STAS domain-containing protein [Planctomycetota bacterium]MDA1163809.1 STAS domain-containing protein [Planctomycetota bacterium]